MLFGLKTCIIWYYGNTIIDSVSYRSSPILWGQSGDTTIKKHNTSIIYATLNMHWLGSFNELKWRGNFQ